MNQQSFYKIDMKDAFDSQINQHECCKKKTDSFESLHQILLSSSFIRMKDFFKHNLEQKER